MTDYSKNTNFTAKDSLVTGNPSKKILGIELDAEFDEIATSIATKLDTPSTASAKASIALPGASGFYAVPSGAQSGVVTATPTQVLFATESYDTAGEFGSSAFTPATTGIYLLTATVLTSTAINSGSVSQIWLSAGGTALAGQKSVAGGTSAQIHNVSWIGSLTGGVAVSVQYQHTHGSNVTLTTGGSNGVSHFSGTRLA